MTVTEKLRYGRCQYHCWGQFFCLLRHDWCNANCGHSITKKEKKEYEERGIL